MGIWDWTQFLTGSETPDKLANVAQSAPVAGALSVTSFLSNLGDGKLWASVGWLALGIVFMLLGVVLWAKDSILPRLPGIP